MKNLYRITNKNGATLGFQIAENEEQAKDIAKMYGVRGVKNAEFVSEND